LPLSLGKSHIANHHVNIAERLMVIAHQFKSIHNLHHLITTSPVSAFLTATNTKLIYSTDLQTNLVLPSDAFLTQPEDEIPRRSLETVHAEERLKMIFSNVGMARTIDATPPSTDRDLDNQSTTIIPSGRIRAIQDFERIEILVRHEITLKPKSEIHDSCGPHLCHAAVLYQMFNAFPEDELHIINNRNQRIQLPTYKKWTDEKYYKKHFDIHVNPGKGG
jgi:hypothetical protein